MKEIKLKYRTFENTLELLRDYWEENRLKEHLSLSVLLLAQMAHKPGITSNLYLPALIKFIDRNGIYGVDGIFLSAISCALSFKGNKTIIKDSFAICKSIKRNKQDDFKSPLFIPFFDFLGSSINTLGNSILDRVPDRIRGRNLTSGLNPLEPIPKIIGRRELNSNVYEYTRDSSISDIYDQNKFHNVMTSFFPDINRDKIFEEFGLNIHEREGEMLNFGKSIRNSGSQHYDRPEIGNRNLSWYMSSDGDPWGDLWAVSFGIAGTAGGLVAGIATAPESGGASIPALAVSGGILGFNLGNSTRGIRKALEEGATNILTAIDPLGIMPNTDNGNTDDNQSSVQVEIEIEYVGPGDDSTDSSSNDDNDSVDMDFTNEGIGEDDNPNDEVTFPNPEANPKPTIPAELVGKILGDILSGAVNPHIVYPNPEALNKKGLSMIKDIRIDKRDHYIYPNPNQNDRKYYLIDEDKLKNLVKRDLINPGDPQND